MVKKNAAEQVPFRGRCGGTGWLLIAHCSSDRAWCVINGDCVCEREPLHRAVRLPSRSPKGISTRRNEPPTPHDPQRKQTNGFRLRHSWRRSKRFVCVRLRNNAPLGPCSYRLRCPVIPGAYYASINRNIGCPKSRRPVFVLRAGSREYRLHHDLHSCWRRPLCPGQRGEPSASRGEGTTYKEPMATVMPLHRCHPSWDVSLLSALPRKNRRASSYHSL